MRFSPAGLQHRMSAELNYLSTIEESVHQISDIERVRGISLAQQESVSLALILKVRLMNLKFLKILSMYFQFFISWKFQFSNLSLHVQNISINNCKSNQKLFFFAFVGFGTHCKVSKQRIRRLIVRLGEFYFGSIQGWHWNSLKQQKVWDLYSSNCVFLKFPKKRYSYNFQKCLAFYLKQYANYILCFILKYQGSYTVVFVF